MALDRNFTRRGERGVGQIVSWRLLLLACLGLTPTPTVAAAGQTTEGPNSGPPAWLPRYEVDMDLDVAGRQARVRMQATWTNMHPTTPVRELVFNAHSRYVVPDSQIGFMAKMLEILRMNPGESLGTETPCCDIHKVSLVPPPGSGRAPQELNFRYEGDTLTALVVPLPHAVPPGASVTVTLDLTMNLPAKQGRWGQWEGVTYLSHWLPVFAFFGDRVPTPMYFYPKKGAPGDLCGVPGEKAGPCAPPAGTEEATWQPVPFVPWHQPYFNEAATYEVRLTLPCDHKVACSGTIVSARNVGEGRQEMRIRAVGVRDLALLCSARYRVYEGEVRAAPGVSPVRVRVLAFPEHEHYAREMVRIAVQAITVYSQWLGPYPWADFTIAEAFFGWNGNECSTLVMIDERIFSLPHLAGGYVEYLVSHEICHQWWYNLVGTNGYGETWMDEAMATHFSHRLLNHIKGRKDNLMKYPAGLEWLPNVRREDYRSYGMYGTFGRGENAPVVQDMARFGHLVNLFSLCYDKGARIVAMIEDRLGEQAFVDFSRRVVTKYRYRIIRVSDYQRELEAYTGPACAGQTWEEFFQHWLYGAGLSDWVLKKAHVQPEGDAQRPSGASPRTRLGSAGGPGVVPACPCDGRRLFGRLFGPRLYESCEARSYRVVVWLEQRGDYNEPTTLGFAIPGSAGFPVRVQVLPYGNSYAVVDPAGQVEVTQVDGRARVRVEVVLPFQPSQIAVDPDQVLVDAEPSNNFWHPPVRVRFTPLFTFLEETDLTNAYDRWNVIAGPWIYGASYNDAWYTRSTMLGVRAAAYRTQQFSGGAYAAYRTDFRDVVTGVDGLWSHVLDPHVQVGFNAEKRLAGLYHDDDDAKRAVLWGRYVFQYGSSLYLPPMHFVEGFAAYQDNFLPFPRQANPMGERFDRTSSMGLHYRLNYLTPYFDPEGGFQFDAWYEGGIADIPQHVGFHKLSSQFSIVKGLPDLSGQLPADSWMREALGPVLSWVGDTRLAMRLYGGTSMPGRGEFFTMGGGHLFRGFDLAERQGSTVWVGSVEWRVPLAKRLHVDLCDHIIGLRNVYGAVFYDVGDSYINGRSVGPVAHAFGGGLRLDVSWFSFVERTMLTVDVAKTVNSSSPTQVWFGIMQPF